MLVLRVFSRITAALRDQLQGAVGSGAMFKFESFIQSVEAVTTSGFIEKACQQLRRYEFDRSMSFPSIANPTKC